MSWQLLAGGESVLGKGEVLEWASEGLGKAEILVRRR